MKKANRNIPKRIIVQIDRCSKLWISAYCTPSAIGYRLRRPGLGARKVPFAEFDEKRKMTDDSLSSVIDGLQNTKYIVKGNPNTATTSSHGSTDFAQYW